MMKQRVISAEYHKVSETFPTWLKYKVTIMNGNGTTSVIPAYGKDLQDALSRVSHDIKVDKVIRKTDTIPWWVFVASWFIYLTSLALVVNETDNVRLLSVGLIAVAAVGTLILRWANKRNVNMLEKNIKKDVKKVK